MIRAIWFTHRNTSVILGEHFDSFIRSEIESGRYGSISEIIRSGLRLLEDEKKKIDSINEVLTAGEKNGTPKLLILEEFKQKTKKKYHVNA